MAILLTAGLLLGTLTGAAPIEHRVALDHPSGTVEAEYRSALAVTHRQIGTASAPGRPSSLRCQWRADLTVTREARHAAGTMLRHESSHQGVLDGSRPGWCTTNRAAIAREVASRQEALRDHLIAVAKADEARLLAEVERAHGRVEG